MTKEKFPHTGGEIEHLRKFSLGETMEEFSYRFGVDKGVVNN